MCAVGGQPRSGKREAAQDAKEILKGTEKAKPGTDVAHFMGQGPSIAIPSRQWNLPEWAKALEPLANTIAKWTAGLGGALTTVGIEKDNLEAAYPGGLSGESFEQTQQIEKSTKPQGAGTAGEMRARETSRPNEADTTGTTHDASASATPMAELHARRAAVRIERAELQEMLTALGPAESQAATAAAIGMSAVGTQSPRHGRPPLAAADQPPPARAPKRHSPKRRSPERER